MLILRYITGLLLAGTALIPAYVDAAVLGSNSNGADVPREALVVLTGRAELAGLAQMPTRAARGAEVMRRKQAVAERQQAALLAWLTARGIEHRPFWVVNAVWVRATDAELRAIRARADVASIAANPSVRMGLPKAEPEPKFVFGAKSVEYGNALVQANTVWAHGTFGQGVVVAGADTGYQWDHPALKAHYLGWDGNAADHGYHWHDAIHPPQSGGTNPCGYDSPVPCDDNGHGTHTMGTMVGDDGLGNQIGLAPMARWIACRNMDRGDGTPARYIECFQWFIAPTDAQGQNPDPSRAPAVIGNSWSCPPSEGCDFAGTQLLQQAVDAVHAAGILVVVAAGNSGSACGSVSNAPGSFVHAFAVGATDSSDHIASFSSRGPTLDGRLKPQVTAPGVSVRSSYPYGDYKYLSGTSMATPHVVGVAALVLSAAPGLVGKPDELGALLEASAHPLTSTQNCGSYPGSAIPNAVFGHGRVDAAEAYDQALPAIFSDEFE